MLKRNTIIKSCCGPNKIEQKIYDTMCHVHSANKLTDAKLSWAMPGHQTPADTKKFQPYPQIL